MMSLVASALRMDLDVEVYLEGVLTHMLRGTAKTQELLPDRWTAAHRRGGARVPRARATRHGRSGRCTSSTAWGTCGAPQRQIVRQEGWVRRGVYPWVLRAPRKEPPTYARRAAVAYRLPPQCWLRRATSRSIHLEPLTGLGHFCKPELHSILPRCLYAYVRNVVTRRSQAYSPFIRIALLQSKVPAKIAPNPTKLEC